MKEAGYHNEKLSQDETPRDYSADFIAWFITIFKFMYFFLLVVFTSTLIIMFNFGPTADNGKDLRTSGDEAIMTRFSMMVTTLNFYYAIGCIICILGKLGVIDTKPGVPMLLWMVLAGTETAILNGMNYFFKQL